MLNEPCDDQIQDITAFFACTLPCPLATTPLRPYAPSPARSCPIACPRPLCYPCCPCPMPPTPDRPISPHRRSSAIACFHARAASASASCASHLPKYNAAVPRISRSCSRFAGVRRCRRDHICSRRRPLRCTLRCNRERSRCNRDLPRCRLGLSAAYRRTPPFNHISFCTRSRPLRARTPTRARIRAPI